MGNKNGNIKTLRANKLRKILKIFINFDSLPFNITKYSLSYGKY